MDLDNNYCPTPLLDEEQIVTNSSFIHLKESEILPNIIETPLGFKTPVAKLSSIELDRTLTFKAVGVLKAIFLKEEEKLIPEMFISLTVTFKNIIKDFPPYELEKFKSKLMGHAGVYDDGHPWMDLEAACHLSLHPDLWRPSVPQPSLPCPALNPKIKNALQDGRYVPMQHILHSLALSRFNPDMEDYPLSFTQSVPLEFISRIKKSDVIRGANVHALLLGSKFPLLAVRIPGIIDELWHFMFPNRFPAMAGMELYNEFFFDVSKQLGNCVVPPLEHINPTISEKVAGKYIPDLQIHSS